MSSFLILGAGLAGFFMADALLEQGISGKEICILEAGGIAEQASGTPSAILHPLTGVSLYPKPGHFEAYQMMEKWIQSKQSEFGGDWAIPVSMTHLTLPGLRGERTQKSFHRAITEKQYPEWLHYTTSKDSQPHDLQKHFSSDVQWIQLPHAYSFSIPDLLHAWQKRLQEQGVSIVTQTPIQKFFFQKGTWTCFSEKEQWKAENVLLCCGPFTKELFPKLPIVWTEGDLLVATPPQDISLTSILTGSSHLAPMPNGKWAMGATFRHTPERREDHDEWVTEWLLARMESIFPAIRRVEDIQVWSGVRTAVAGNRYPICGEIPFPKMFLFSALGAKGLLWSKFCANTLAEQILQGKKSTFAEFRTTRFEPSLWESPWIDCV